MLQSYLNTICWGYPLKSRLRLINKQIFEKKSADFKKAFKQALSEDKKYKAIKFSLIALLGFIIVGAVLLPDKVIKIKEQSEKEKVAEKQEAAKEKADSAQETEPVKKGYGTAVIVNLKRAGPTSAEVEYKGQEITVRKYYPEAGSLMGGSTDLKLLVPCIGHQVIAGVDNHGEILGLYCPDKKNKSLAESIKEGSIEGTVLVVPDEYINVR